VHIISESAGCSSAHCSREKHVPGDFTRTLPYLDVPRPAARKPRTSHESRRVHIDKISIFILFYHCPGDDDNIFMHAKSGRSQTTVPVFDLSKKQIIFWPAETLNYCLEIDAEKFGQLILDGNGR
jgi:hypothetical protein